VGVVEVYGCVVVDYDHDVCEGWDVCVVSG